MEILQYAFFQRAILAAIVVSVAAGIIGTFITVKRLSLVSGSIAHSAFGGLGIAYFLGQNPILGALSFSALASAFLALVRKSAKDRFDILLNLLWTVGMAIGLIFIFLTPGYSTDLFTYLFGNILLVNTSDIWLMFILDVVILVSVLFTFHKIVVVMFNEEYAEIRNVNVTGIYLMLFLLISFTVVLVIRAVGIVLMIALLTIPPATALFYAKSVKKVALISVGLNMVSIISGLFLSYYLNLPTGPVIVLISAMFYILSMIYNKFVGSDKF